MTPPNAAERLIESALVRVLEEIRTERKLGIRSAVLPTETAGARGLKATVSALSRALERLGEPTASALVGSNVEEASSLSTGSIQVLPPEEAAAAATSARCQDEPWPLIYLCEVDVAGASGLSMLAELTSWHLFQAAVDEYGRNDLPIMHNCIQGSCPRVVRELLERVSFSDLQAYVAESRDGRHLEALPLLGLLPASLFPAERTLHPKANWCNQLERLIGLKATNRVEQAQKKLREVIESDDKEWIEAAAEAIRRAQVIPAGVHGAREELRWVSRIATQARRITECDSHDLMGLSKGLIDRLLRGEGVVPRREQEQPPRPPPPPGPGGTPPGPPAPPPELTLAESQVLIAKLHPDGTLQVEQDRMDALSSWPPHEESDHPITAPEHAVETMLESPLVLRVCRPDDPTMRLTATEEGWDWPSWRFVEGACGDMIPAGAPVVEVTGGAQVERLIDNTVGQATVEPRRHSCRDVLGRLQELSGVAGLTEAVERYKEARLLLVQAAGALVAATTEDAAEEGQPAPTEAVGLAVLRRLPLVACARLREQVEACLTAHDTISAIITAEGYERVRAEPDLLHQLLVMDTVVAYDGITGEPKRLQLLPLHPIALGTWLLRLDTGDPTMVIQSAFRVAGHTAPGVLGSTPNPLVYSAGQRVSPADASIEQCASWLFDSVWALLSHGRPGLTGAVNIELADLPSPQIAAKCIDLLVESAEHQRRGDASDAAPFLHLDVSLVSLRFSDEAWLPSELGLKSVLDLLKENTRDHLGVGAGSDLSLRVRLGSFLQTRDEVPSPTLAHGRLEVRPGRRSPAIIPDGPLSNARSQYKVDRVSGGILRVESPDQRGVQGWRQLARRLHMSADTDIYYTMDALNEPAKALVSGIVARGGWPLPQERADDLLAYSLFGPDTVAVVLDRDLADAIAERAVSAAAETLSIPAGRPGLQDLMPNPVKDFAAIQRGCRYFLDDGRDAPLQLLQGRGGVRLLERVSKARAFMVDADDWTVLVISLDGRAGHALAQRLRGIYGDASRTDLLRLVADVDEHGTITGLSALEFVELKASQQALLAGSPAGRASLSLQARRMRARIGACTGASPNEEVLAVQEGLRALCWLGAGAFRVAHTWMPALEHLDRWLAGERPLQVQVALWACPPESGESEHGSDVVALIDPATGAELDGQTEPLHWRVLRPERAHRPDIVDEVDDPDRVDPTPEPATSDPVQHTAAGEPGDTTAVSRGLSADPLPKADTTRGTERGSERDPSVEPQTVDTPQPMLSERQEPLRPVVQLGLTPGRLEPVLWDPFSGTRPLTNAHMMIVGGSGSGKTQALKSLTSSLADQGVSLLILDFKDDYVSPAFRQRIGAGFYDALGGLPINPLALTADPLTGMLTPMVHTYAVAGLLEQVFGLGAQQRAHLIEAIRATYEAAGIPMESHEPVQGGRFPAFRDLREHLVATSDVTLLNRIQALFDLGVFDGARGSIDELLKTTTVIRLTKLPAETDKKAVGALILQSVYYALLRQGHSEGLRVAVVIDEAHRVANLKPVELLMKEARAFGASIMLSSQEPGDFHDSLVANAGSHLVLQVTEARAARDAARLVVGSAKAAAAAEKVRRLQTFHALFRNNHHPDAVEVRVTPFFERETP